MQLYEEYEDSQIEWIGEKPSHWKIEKIKYNLPIRGERVLSKESDLSYVGMENISSNTGEYINSATEVEGLASCFFENDILFGKLRPYLAKVYAPNFEGICSTEFIVFQSANPRYFQKLLISKRFIDFVNASTYGSKMPRVSPEWLSNQYIPIPPVHEQTAIANFLDRKTALIDQAIAQKERLIELLRERQQIVIQQAVTRGLDPDVPMKDSGVEWIGEVPEHWEVKKLKHILKSQGRIGFKGYTTSDQVGEGEGALVLGASHLNWNGELVLSDPKYLSWKKYYESPEIMVSQGDVLIVQRGSTCGKVALVNHDLGPTTRGVFNELCLS